MSRFACVSRLGAAVLAAVALGCGDDPDVITQPRGAGGELFRTYVALGNSITAGFQSGGINDSTQRESYAVLLAESAGTPFVYPSLALPGCPPPIANFQTQARVTLQGQPPSNSTTCAFRDPALIEQIVHNLAVPGATTQSLTSTSDLAGNPLTTFFLGGRSQVERAIEANPTFASIWIGNNDVLGAAVSGVLTRTTGISPGITTLADFTGFYASAVNRLVAGSPRLDGGVLIGVVDVQNAPILFTAQALMNPAVKGAIEAAAGGRMTIVTPDCATTASLVSLIGIVSFIRSYPAGQTPIISCTKNSPAPGLGDIGILDAAEQATVATTVASYNAYIRAKADSVGFAYFDPNPALLQLRASGQIPAIPNFASATAPFGDFVSLDGIHPRRPAHVLIANSVIDVVNAKFGLSIPRVT